MCVLSRVEEHNNGCFFSSRKQRSLPTQMSAADTSLLALASTLSSVSVAPSTSTTPSRSIRNETMFHSFDEDIDDIDDIDEDSRLNGQGSDVTDRAMKECDDAITLLSAACNGSSLSNVVSTTGKGSTTLGSSTGGNNSMRGGRKLQVVVDAWGRSPQKGSPGIGAKANGASHGNNTTAANTAANTPANTPANTTTNTTTNATTNTSLGRSQPRLHPQGIDPATGRAVAGAGGGGPFASRSKVKHLEGVRDQLMECTNMPTMPTMPTMTTMTTMTMGEEVAGEEEHEVRTKRVREGGWQALLRKRRDTHAIVNNGVSQARACL